MQTVMVSDSGACGALHMCRSSSARLTRYNGQGRATGASEACWPAAPAEPPQAALARAAHVHLAAACSDALASYAPAFLPLPDTSWARNPAEYLARFPTADFFISTDCLSAAVEEAWRPGHNQPRCGHVPGNGWGRAFNTGGRRVGRCDSQQLGRVLQQGAKHCVNASLQCLFVGVVLSCACTLCRPWHACCCACQRRFLSPWFCRHLCCAQPARRQAAAGAVEGPAVRPQAHNRGQT